MKVLICVDYSAYTEKIFQAVKTVIGTRVPPAAVTVLYVIDDVGLPISEAKEQAMYAMFKANGEKINALARTYFGDTVTYVEEYGVPQEKIDEALENIPHDLLAFGTKGRSAIVDVLMGSVAQHLLHTSKTPMLIVS